MTSGTITVKRHVLAAVALGALLAGAVAASLWFTHRPDPDPALTSDHLRADDHASAATGTARAPGDVAIALSAEALARADIVVAPVGGDVVSATIRVPGIVQPNAYRQVVVTPLVAGRVTRVEAELGQRVRRGQTLASVYSPELAEAQAKVRAARTSFDAHDRELERTQKLERIGAASREELERVHAEHAAMDAELDAARVRLNLLGGATLGEADRNPSASTVDVPAPLDGTVIVRDANVGLNVEATSPLFTVADLSSVWVVADVFEQDVVRVPEGTVATVTLPADPDARFAGRVTYIDPQIAAVTRTTRMRIEIADERGQLRLGTYVDVALEASGHQGTAQNAVSVPRAAVQTVGARTVVYVADPTEPGRFVERAVRLGSGTGDVVQVASGLQPGDVVVTRGSFFIRAELERMGTHARTERPVLEAASGSPVDVRITTAGFEPATIEVRAGVATRLRFTRVTDDTCATEVVFPSLGVRKDLPLNEPVDVVVTPTSQDLTFACGMDMLRGSLVVRSAPRS